MGNAELVDLMIHVGLWCAIDRAMKRRRSAFE